MTKIYLFFILISISTSVIPQEVNQSYCTPDTAGTLEKGMLKLKVVSNNFLKNNEYFSPFTEGITYFGSMIQPELTYALSDKTRLNIGWFLRYYYGRDKFNTSLPVFRFEYNPTADAHLVFGQLYGLLDHGLIEPIYSADNYFKRNPEYGIQFRLKKNRFHSDIWISWDHFILPGDNAKEEISSGFNSSVQLLRNSGNNSLSIHLQAIVHHFGGQVDNSGTPLETRLNLAPGIEFASSAGYLHNIRYQFSSYLVQAADRSGVGTIPYRKGFASYTYGLFKYQWTRLAVSYFHGEYFFSPLGDPLFQSVSELNDWYSVDKRNLVNGKLLIDKMISKGVYMGIRFESYYDLDLRNLDFCYGMNIRADTGWLLNSRKKNR